MYCGRCNVKDRYEVFVFFFSSRRRHTRWPRDWSSDVCSSDLLPKRYSEPLDSIEERGQGTPEVLGPYPARVEPDRGSDVEHDDLIPPTGLPDHLLGSTALRVRGGRKGHALLLADRGLVGRAEDGLDSFPTRILEEVGLGLLHLSRELALSLAELDEPVHEDCAGLEHTLGLGERRLPELMAPGRAHGLIRAGSTVMAYARLEGRVRLDDVDQGEGPSLELA